MQASHSFEMTDIYTHFDHREKSSLCAQNRNYSIEILMNELVTRSLGVFEDLDQLVAIA